MALHGPIKVNNYETGYWSAQRIVSGEDGANTYLCSVAWTPEGETPFPLGTAGGSIIRTIHNEGATFDLQHDYRDGAVVLAAKVLARAVELAKEE